MGPPNPLRHQPFCQLSKEQFLPLLGLFATGFQPALPLKDAGLTNFLAPFFLRKSPTKTQNTPSAYPCLPLPRGTNLPPGPFSQPTRGSKNRTALGLISAGKPLFPQKFLEESIGPPERLPVNQLFYRSLTGAISNRKFS